MMKKIVCLLLICFMMVLLVACNNTQNYELDRTIGKTSSGVEFSRMVTINGYEFTLPCKVEDFLEGTGFLFTDESYEMYEKIKEGKNVTSDELLACGYYDEETGKEDWHYLVLKKNGKDDVDIVCISTVFQNETGEYAEFGTEYKGLGINFSNGNFYDIDENIRNAMEAGLEEPSGMTKYLSSAYDDKFAFYILANEVTGKIIGVSIIVK